MSPNANIGFHNAFIVDGGNKVITGLASAIIGAFVTKMGLGVDAIVWMTEAGPNDVHWLNEATANQYNIPVKIIPDEALTYKDPTPANPVPPAPDAVPPPPEFSPEHPLVRNFADQDHRWIQIASRGSFADAMAFVQSLNLPAFTTNTYAAIFTSKRPLGWHVIVLGPFPATTADQELHRYWNAWSIPWDARVISGSNLEGLEWLNTPVQS
jgi:hypothetical protein